MELGSLGDKLVFVAAVVGVILLISLMRGRNPRRARADTVRALLSDTRINIILVDTFDRQPKPRDFQVTSWQLSKKKLQFLEKQLQKDLADSFGMALDYNQRLKAAKKEKSNQKVTQDLESMKGVLTRTKQGLEDWLLANMGAIDVPERTSMLDGLFGGR